MAPPPPAAEPEPETKPETEAIAPPPPAPEEPAPAPQGDGKKLFIVHAHGTLQHNGVTYEPGSECSLTDLEAASIGSTVSPKE